MKNILISDLFKLKKHKSVYIALAVMLGVTLILFVMLWALGVSLEKLSSGSDDLELVVSTRTTLALLSQTLLTGFSDGAMVAPLFAIVIGLFVGGEFSSGSVRLQVARGSSRAKLYFSKLITLCSLLFVYLAICIVFSGILTAVRGYGEGGFSNEDLKIVVRNFFLQLLSQISMASIGVMFAFLTRSKNATIGIMLALLIGLDTVFGLLYGLEMLNVNTDWIMFMPLQQLSVACSSTKLTSLQLVAVIVMPTVYASCSTLLGIFDFRRRDIK